MTRDFRFWLLISCTGLAAVLGVTAYFVLTAPLTAKLTLGSDQVNSEPHEMASAIAHVTGRTYPGIDIRVVETGGSSENMKRLADGTLDLALVQADVVSRENVSLLAVLYPDLFQLVVRADSGITNLKDLEGKRIALPPVTSGQYRAFWYLANHYGLAPERIVALPMQTRRANQAFETGKVDAVFRVRGPRNAAIRFLVGSTPLRIIPIDQGRALHLRQPAFNADYIPKGSYQGDPPIPPHELATVAVDRLLVARDDVPEEVTRAITHILFEKRRDLALRTPLAALIRQPEIAAGTMLPVHAGALSYYNREEPSLLEEKAEFLALVLSFAVVVATAMVAFARNIDERRKSRIEDYAVQLLELEKNAKTATTVPELNVHKQRLTDILAEAIGDVRARRVNAEGLQLFSFVWESVNYTVNDHEEQLRLGPGSGPPARKPKTRRKRSDGRQARR